MGRRIKRGNPMLNEQKLKFIDKLRELREVRGLTYQQIADETEAKW